MQGNTESVRRWVDAARRRSLKRGKLQALITQHIDELHQMAGNDERIPLRHH